MAHIRRPGVTLRSVRGARARVDGTIWVDPAARGATVAQLFLTTSDRRFSIPLKVQADDVTVRDDVITGRRNTICLAVGSERPAFGTLIERNRITHCGRAGKLDHLIYLVHSRGAVVRQNVLTHNPGGWAIHLFPDADGSLIEHNRIDHNQGGVIFGGADGETSDGNEVRNNAITFSSPRWNVEASWSGNQPGSGNSVHHNCLYTAGPSPPAGIGQPDGFESFDNVLRSAAGSCAGLVGKVRGPRPLIRTSRRPPRHAGRR